MNLRKWAEGFTLLLMHRNDLAFLKTIWHKICNV